MPRPAPVDPTLVDWLDAQVRGQAPPEDLLARAPGLTIAAAYGLQLALRDRRVAAGDRLIGYKAALTSLAVQRDVGVDEPYFGCLMASGLWPEEAPVSLAGVPRAIVEQEIAVLLKADLPGPGVTPAEALGAVAGFLPAIEVGFGRVERQRRSHQMSIAGSKFSSGIIVGQPLTPPHGLDLRYEGMTLTVNGTPVASGTAVEVLGGPLNSLAAMANHYAALGEPLRAGQLLMTGSVCAASPVRAGDRVAVTFTRLGTVQVRFTA